MDVEGYGYLFLLKQVGCYRYQSCEHPGWQSSASCRWTADLRQMWIRRASREFPGSAVDPALADRPWTGWYPATYDRVPWGIEDDDAGQQRSRTSVGDAQS